MQSNENQSVAERTSSSLTIEDILTITRQQNDFRTSTINMIASENTFLPEIHTDLFFNDFMYRYAEGHPGQRYYNGTKFIDQIESACSSHFSEHFNATADVRPISGAVANIGVFSALPTKNNIVLTNSLPSGGHITHNKMGTATRILGKSVVNFPTQEHNQFKTDVDKTKELLDAVKPDFIIFGKSMIIHPEPVREIRAVYDGPIVYDAAHVLGLIYQGEFQKPFEEGADIMTASTHKTFPGPQGGIILSKKYQEEIDKCVFPGLVSNHHLHRLPALLATALLLDSKYRDYSYRIVKNAQELARILNDNGIKVCGFDGLNYTYTHQVIVDVTEFGGGAAVADKLEQKGIICNKNSLPWDKSVINPSGLRLGVQEITLKNMNIHDVGAKLTDAIKQ